MKRSLCFLISILTVLTLVLSGCADKTAPDGYKNVASDREAFYLYVPTTWVSNTSGGTASAYYSSDDYANVSFTCMVIDPGEMDDLEEYKDITLAELEAVLPEFKAFVTMEVTTPIESAEPSGETVTPVTMLPIDGRDSILFEYQCTLGGQSYSYMQVVTMKDDFFYIFTYTALTENYEKHLEEVKGIIANIDFK